MSRSQSPWQQALAASTSDPSTGRTTKPNRTRGQSLTGLKDQTVKSDKANTTRLKWKSKITRPLTRTLQTHLMALTNIVQCDIHAVRANKDQLQILLSDSDSEVS